MNNQKFRLNERKLFMLVKRMTRECGWDRGEELEICLAGNGKQKFITIKRDTPVVSSKPQPDPKPEEECKTTSTVSESTPSTEPTPKDEKSNGAG